jgi:hypothetical protein
MLSWSMQCGLDSTRVFYLRTYPSIFYYLPYNPVIGFVSKLISYTITLTWAHRDLFIMNIAFALKFHFQQFMEILLAHRDMSASFWTMQRLKFQKLSTLVSDVDEAICEITFLSLAVNVFFICAHLFNGLL